MAITYWPACGSRREIDFYAAEDYDLPLRRQVRATILGRFDLAKLHSDCPLMSTYRASNRLTVLLEKLMLVVLLWSGPVPLAHSHLDVGDSSVAAAELYQHLTCHHACMSIGRHEPEGWHIHWVLRNGAFSGINGEGLLFQVQAENAVDGQVARTLAARTSAEPQLAFDSYASTLSAVGPPLARELLSSTFQLVGFLQSQQSLPEFLGIMRC